MQTLVGYAARGPHPVGVTRIELEDPADPERRLPTFVWYPAAATAGDPPNAEHPIGAPHAAGADAPPRRGGEPCPLIAFSHGNAGFARQSTFLTTHLASWGAVVAAPDHTGNTFFEMLHVDGEDERIRLHRQARENRPRDVATTLDAVLAGGPWPDVDDRRIGVCGHSFGGWTALKLPRRDARVRAICALAPASEPFVGRKAFEPGELPLPGALPSLLVAALDDVLVDVDASVRPLFGRLAEPRTLVGVAGADHFHFCDHLELLHGLHERNRRPNQTRETRPYAQLIPEAWAHRLTAGLAAAFFASVLGEGGGPLDLSPPALAALEPALSRLDAALEPMAATR